MVLLDRPPEGQPGDRPEASSHAPAIREPYLRAHDDGQEAQHIVERVLHGACSAEAPLTPAQCALLAHDLPTASRYGLIEQLCAALQRLTSERDGSEAAMPAKDLLAAALERDASLTEARAKLQAQKAELARLRAENLTMHAQLLEREAQLAWPSVRGGPSCALRPNPRDGQAASRFPSPLRRSARPPGESLPLATLSLIHI